MSNRKLKQAQLQEQQEQQLWGIAPCCADRLGLHSSRESSSKIERKESTESSKNHPLARQDSIAR